MPPLSIKEKAYVQEWLDLATHDLRAAERMVADSPSTFGYLIAFVAQQATEKLVKAALLTQAITFPKTHDIPALLVLLSQHITFTAADYSNAATLADYAVEVRYPGKKINLVELQAAVQMAQQFEQRLLPFVQASLV